MANALYPKFKEALLIQSPDIDFDASTIKLALVDTGTYTYSAAHDFYDDVSAGVVGTPQTLTNKTYTDGVFDCSDTLTFTSLTGNTVEAIVIYKDTGTPATSALIAYFDTGVTGLPLTPNGGNVTVDFHASGIFAL